MLSLQGHKCYFRQLSKHKADRKLLMYSTSCDAVQTDPRMTSNYRESDSKAHVLSRSRGITTSCADYSAQRHMKLNAPLIKHKTNHNITRTPSRTITVSSKTSNSSNKYVKTSTLTQLFRLTLATRLTEKVTQRDMRDSSSDKHTTRKRDAPIQRWVLNKNRNNSTKNLTKTLQLFQPSPFLPKLSCVCFYCTLTHPSVRWNEA